jgi:hypothetical protein
MKGRLAPALLFALKREEPPRGRRLFGGMGEVDLA